MPGSVSVCTVQVTTYHLPDSMGSGASDMLCYLFSVYSSRKKATTA